MRLLGILLALCLSATAWAGDLAFGYAPMPGPGEKPAFIVTPPRAVAELTVVIEAGGGRWEFTRRGLPGGTAQRFEFPRNDGVTEAVAWVTCEFSDAASEEVRVPFTWNYSAPLKIDLSRASANVVRRVLTVNVTAEVDGAEVIAYGAHKKVLDQRTVALSGGPGELEVPWVGRPEDVVLLDVKLTSGGAWASFTYSPWFLNIPHEDVLFETNQAAIRPEEEPKLVATLEQLRGVLDKYGSVVPVKLYIAGCTDTVGSSGSNMELSRRRARAIASWLRSHGYTRPIYYHGFGEDLPAVPTDDDVDMAANRRALYMVGANPPPAGSGIPSVTWIPL